jgi:hypothetical protein
MRSRYYEDMVGNMMTEQTEALLRECLGALRVEDIGEALRDVLSEEDLAILGEEFFDIDS